MHCCPALATYPEVVAHRAGTRPGRSQNLPPYLVLLRVGFALPAALLPRRCALTAPFHPYLAVVLGPLGSQGPRPCASRRTHNDSEAVCFLWHFPSTGLEPGLPDVIRHTALRSSDFPLPLPGATVRSGCLHCYYMRLQEPQLLGPGFARSAAPGSPMACLLDCFRLQDTAGFAAPSQVSRAVMFAAIQYGGTVVLN